MLPVIFVFMCWDLFYLKFTRFQVFNVVRKEVWYLPDLSLFNNMIMMLGKHKMIEMVEQLLVELRNEGLEPDARTYTEVIGAYFKVEMVKKAMETYEAMKASGLVPDKLTLTILIRNLETAGEEALAESVKKECPDYFDYPKKFLKEVEKTYVSILTFTRNFSWWSLLSFLFVLR